MIKLYNFDELRPEEILNRDIRAEKNVEDVVDGIIADVRARGDDALKDYALKFDGAKIDALQVTQEEIDEDYAGTVIQEETDIILEGEMKFFVWVSKERWGFVVLPILRDQEELYKGAETFFDFEDDTWELNFFDGRK